MLVFRCDGESYTNGRKCESEAEDELPTRWLSITGKIKNGLYDAHYIECNGVRHFCSRRCLENFLFKNVNPPADSPAPHTMQNFDPKEGQEEVKEQATEIEQSPAPTAGEAMESAEEEG